jgi:hypothetical protein
LITPPYYRAAYSPDRVVAATHPLGMTRQVETAAGRASVQAELFNSGQGWRFLKVFVFDSADDAAEARGWLDALDGVTVDRCLALVTGSDRDEVKRMVQNHIETVDVQELFRLVAGLDPDKKRELASLLKKQAKRQEEAKKAEGEAEVITAEQALSQAEYDQRFAFDAAQALQIGPLREKLRKLGVADRTQSRATRVWRKLEKDLRKHLIGRGIPPGPQLDAELERESLLWFTSEETLKRFPMEGYTARLSTAKAKEAAIVGGRWHINYATGAWTFADNSVDDQDAGIPPSEDARGASAFAPLPVRTTC